jgi:hypothetical protein
MAAFALALDTESAISFGIGTGAVIARPQMTGVPMQQSPNVVERRFDTGTIWQRDDSAGG